MQLVYIVRAKTLPVQFPVPIIIHPLLHCPQACRVNLGPKRRKEKLRILQHDAPVVQIAHIGPYLQLEIGHRSADVKPAVEFVIPGHNKRLPEMLRTPVPERPLPHFPVPQVRHIPRQHQHIANQLYASVLNETHVICKLQMQI